MKKIWKIVAAVLAITLIGVILFFTNAFAGNPISKYFANQEIANYIDEEYGHLDLSIVEAGYNFKDSSYFGLAQSKTSEDTHFYVHVRKGKVIYDDYSFMVEERENTLQRFEREYSQIVRNIINDEVGYPENNSSLMYLRDDRGADIKDLFQLDAPFDPSLPLETEVYISLELEDPSVDNVARLLEDTHRAFLTHEYYFDKYHFLREYDHIFVNVFNITPAEIESGELTEILEKDEERFIKNND